MFCFPVVRMSCAPQHVIWEAEGLVAYLNPRPWTPGCVILEQRGQLRLGGSIFHLEQEEFMTMMLGARAVAELLCDRLAVQRCALVSRPHLNRSVQVQPSWFSVSAVQDHHMAPTQAFPKPNCAVQNV